MGPLDRKILDSLKSNAGDGQPSLLETLIPVYMENSSELMETLRKAISLGDATAMQSAAHGLKSASGNIGAMTLAECCKELESIGRAGTTESSSSVLPVLELEYERVCEALVKELKEMTG